MENAKRLIFAVPALGMALLALLFASLGIAIVLFITSILGGQTEQNYGFNVGLTEIGENQIPAEFIGFYTAAGERYGIPWTLLAGIHKVETNFSINKTDSYVGATGAMQFMPCTWVGWGYPGCSGVGKGNISKDDLINPSVIAKYGGYGVDGDGDGKADPMNEADAIMSAANYLAANGANGTRDGMKKAVFAYNHADWYVDRVMGYFDQYTLGFETIEINAKAIFHGSNAHPVIGFVHLTSPFGPRWGTLHKGVDFAPPGNLKGNSYPIAAFADGTVVAAQGNCGIGNRSCGGGYGNFVMIDHGNGLKTVYAHMEQGSVQVGLGRNVKAGDVLGLMGNTGDSTGKHLHFEVIANGTKVNPAPYLQVF